MTSPPPPPPPPDLAFLVDELVEEFLLCLAPDDPEPLARAALVSTQWYRVVTGPSFRRRFCELHRSAPPLLGYILTFKDSIRFVPLSSFRPPRTRTDRGGVQAVSSSHGRVLLHLLFKKDLVWPRHPVRNVDVHLSVWDPVTDEQQDLPVVPLRPPRSMSMYENEYCVNWDAAIVCAAGDGCDHLHCRFMVVFMGNHRARNFSCVYSSEAGRWSDPVFAAEEYSRNTFVPGECIPIGTALYTSCGAMNGIFKYDLQTHQMCNVSTAPTSGFDSRLIAAEDGRLGIAELINSTLRLWLRENGRWEESRAIDLHTLLPADALEPRPLIIDQLWVVAFADTGAGVIFLKDTCWVFHGRSEVWELQKDRGGLQGLLGSRCSLRELLHSSLCRFPVIFTENRIGSYNTVKCRSMKFLQKRYDCLWPLHLVDRLVCQRCFMMHRVYPSIFYWQIRKRNC